MNLARTIDHIPIAALKPRPGNPRTHSKEQIRQIARSIEQFGFTNPILIDDHNGVVAGHGRLAAAKTLGWSEVPTLRLSNLSEAEIRAYVIADNKLAENAGWDAALLKLEFKYLSDLDIDIDPTITGFAPAEIDAFTIDATSDVTDDVPQIDNGPAITRPGDLWLIGPHRLLCGDATDESAYQALLGDERAHMVFSDPPYNVKIGGHVSGNGAFTHREFVMGAGEMNSDEFTAFLRGAFANMAAYSVDGSIHFHCMDWRHVSEMLAAGNAAYSELKNICVWAKTNGGMGSLYRSQHEFVFMFKSGKAPHINNIELGKYGRNRTNLWTYPGANSFGNSDLSLHPTVKPVALVADAIKDCSQKKHTILDAFAGSGSTLVAADQTGRRGFGLELDPRYCDVIIKRMKALCAREATLAATGETFAARANSLRREVET